MLHRSRLRPSDVAFTLVEIMVVVVVIGLLAALALPALARVQTATRINSVANDFRVFTQAFETYSTSKGGWPPNASAGAVPSGMSKSWMKVSVWQATTPIGGNWNWDLDVNGVAAAISISGFTCDDATLTAIDAKLDDGDLTTGVFQRINGRVMYILQQ